MSNGMCENSTNWPHASNWINIDINWVYKSSVHQIVLRYDRRAYGVSRGKFQNEI